MSVVDSLQWLTGAGVSPMIIVCPNCGDSSGKSIVLRSLGTKGNAEEKCATLLSCENCKCGFFHPAITANYESEPVGGDSALAFYLQQGAGLWSITSILSALNQPAGARFLEIGCGFGFGLDFAQRTLGWEVLGLDPSPLAAAGRACLNLPIESRYLTANEAALAGRFDVVMASEVVEHVSSPPAFAQTLRMALREGGTLVLTTPDVSAVRPDTPPGLLVPLLSIGYHLVLQSKDSLATLLRNAGFVDVEVSQIGGASLVARCRRGPVSDVPAPVLPASTVVSGRGLYRRYLRDAAAAVQSDSDLWFGLMVRAYREAVNAADDSIANKLWEDLSIGCRRRFGFDAEAGASHLNDTTGVSLEILAAEEPLCLGPMLLHRAFHRMLGGATRAEVEGLFARAAEACERLRRSLRRIGTDDGDIEDITWIARAEELLCAAERGAAGVVDRFLTLGPDPADFAALRNGGPRRREQFRRRIFVSLVNAGRLDDADRFDDVISEVEARVVSSSTVLASDELDVLYCAATRELQRPKGGAPRALELLQRLDTACTAARAVGCSGSAVMLVAPARSAKILALEVLGRKSDAAALRLENSVAQAGRQNA